MSMFNFHSRNCGKVDLILVHQEKSEHVCVLGCAASMSMCWAKALHSHFHPWLKSVFYRTGELQVVICTGFVPFFGDLISATL